MRYLTQCAVRELLRRKTGTLITVFGYAVAVVVFVVFSNILVHSNKTTGEILKHTGTHFMAIIPGCGRKNCGVTLRNFNEGLEINGIQTLLISEKMVAHMKKLPEIKDAAIFLAFRMYDSLSQSFFTIGGFDPGNDYVVSTTCCAAGDVIAGRFLTSIDTNAVLLHENYARMKRYGVHDSVKISGIPCIVVGIINPGIRPAQADVYVNLPYARKLIKKRLHGSSLAAKGNALLVETASSLLHEKAFTYLKKEGFTLSTYKCYKPAAKVIGLNEKSAWLLIILIIAGVILFAVKSQLSSVLERIRELAVLRAIGWSGRHIVQLIVTESVIQAICGCIVGAVLSACVLAGVSGTMIGGNALFPETMPVFTFILISVIIVICGGVIAGVIPAVYAIQRKPSVVFHTL